jgi:hypothetical protein
VWPNEGTDPDVQTRAKYRADELMQSAGETLLNGEPP